ncbi:interleukin-like EMT inducer domain-containing protein [Clostridium perfringens]
MLDSDGVHNAGITNGAIDNNKVADNANISGNKLDINSVIREVNNNGTETIKGTKVTVGDRTLDVELSTQNNTITEHSKELSSQKASLTALDNALKFKVDSQTFTQSTTTINNNINRAKEEAINSANNAINNLQISFRNLAINSNFDFGWKNWGFNNPNNNATVQIIKDSVLGNCVKVTTQTSGQGVYSILKRKPKTTYSWSFMIKSDKTCKITVAHEYGEGTKEISLTTEWTKITGTGIWNGNGGALCFYSNVDNPQITYYLTNLIYVEGDKVGDWTPAPEDLKAYSDDVAKAKADLAQANAIANADGKITTEEQKRIQQAQENLNIAISKADKAKQDAILEANRVAELKKQEAINSSNSHADSKANEALNNAKAFVNSEITNVNTHLNKNTSEINILKGQIESKVSQSDIDKSIQNIEFGGRNLFLKSKGPFKSSNEYVGISITSVVEKYLNKKITISADVKANKVGKIRFYSLGGYSVGFWVERDVTTEWTRIKATGKFTLNDEKQKWCDLSFYGTYGSGLFTEVRNVKIELGELASDYTEAPEDTDKLIIDNIKTVTDKITTVESKFTQENNSIKASVQDLNSTTQTITTSVSNLNRDLTSKINSNLDASKNFATDIATNKANTAKQEAISSANSHADNIAASKATEAINNAKAYTNAEITTVNSKVHNVESNLNILSDRINTKVSQSDIDKAVTTIRTEIIIYARGTGNDYPANSIVKVNGKTITDGQGRGLRINALNKSTLERVFLQDYDTFGSEDAKVSFVNKINELNNGDFIIIITSQDASYPLHQPIKEALEKIGATLFDNKQGTYREAYALIGKSKLGRGNGVEMFIPRTANDKRFAEVSVKVGEDGTFIGVNSNNIGLEATLIKSNISDVSSSVTQLRDSVTTDIRAINSKTQSIETTLNGKASKQEVTEVNNRVATIKASLDSITQRVSSTESKAQTLESNINDKASKQEVVNINGRVTNVETNLNGITNRVSATESRINTLDGRIASAVTIQQFTEYKQSNRDFQLRVAQTTNLHNLVPNGTFAGGLREWICGGEFWSGPYTGYGFSGKVCGAVKNKSTSEKFLTSYKSFKVEKNTTYTLNFHYKVEQNIQSMEAFVMLSNTESGDYGQVIRVMQALGGERSDLTNDIPYSFTFNTGNFEWVWLRFDNNGMKPNTNLDEYCWLYISEVAVYKGNVGAVKYLPKGGETYDTTFKLDGMGYNCKFASGAWNQIGEEGNMWYAPGMKYPYRSLSYHEAVSINTDGSNNYIYRDVQLPARFDYVDPQYIDITASLKGWYKYTGKPFSSENITVSTGRVYRANGHTYAQVACRGCIRDNDTFTTEGLQVVATLHVTA